MERENRPSSSGNFSRPGLHSGQRPATSTSTLGKNPFEGGTDSRPATGTSNGNPFTSRSGSRPTSSNEDSSAGVGRFEDRSARYFHSRRVKKGDIEKPWTKNVDPKEKWVTILPLIGIFIGLGISGFLVWDGIRSVVKHEYCPVLDDDFSRGLDPAIWEKEVQLGGFGNGEFQMTTGDDNNVFVENGRLVIRATLQDDGMMQKDTLIDLREDGLCTSTNFYDCVAATNTTVGNSSIVPPVLSGRITTRPGATIKYGRIEVTAKLPAGDWLWPAIWMMPVDSAYGPWPQSGEIDIAESRGNNYTYPQGGNNIVSSALHWGPNPANDAFWRTNVKRPALHTTYSADFNTFGLEWSQKYLFTYVNSRLLQVLYTNFDQPLWERGSFPTVNANGTRILDPWGHTGRHNTPFDQRFFLILNVAVGGTNGWFEDNTNEKPWLNASPNAKKDFWLARDRWFPTWTQPQMEVSRVKIWQQCDGNEDL
ncbi:beta-1,3-glucan-binding protein [Podospora aff. communis PSN243]|uniref:Beta-1,3-glucan-binding protein n=1 Tax=Podospora aff. communis PSN243 TaxID=3040156 RepID=A0AAV9GDX7_9PEZI|nr:beta-1,3-glucan-binding protein [Podospora aff. communis PSN243]